MGSPLSPVIANFFMEDFKEEALKGATHKPLCWFRYGDDIFMIWPHVQENRTTSSFTSAAFISTNIQFTMEMETGGHIPILNIDVYRRLDSWLGYRIYRKPTHTNFYLNARSRHHPAKKQAVLSTVVHRVKAIYDPDSLQ
jgi:hypothetical protein